jgi:hypothetical protein
MVETHHHGVPGKRTVAALVRKYRRGTDRELLNKLRDFIRYGTPEEKQLMAEVLDRRDAIRDMQAEHEIPLLSAFETIFKGWGRMLVRVPDALRDEVKYLLSAPKPFGMTSDVTSVN